MYYPVSASVGDTITQKRHCSLPARDEFTIYKEVQEKHYVFEVKQNWFRITDLSRTVDTNPSNLT